MTTGFLVAWMAVSWNCPFGLGKAPDAVKAIVCEKTTGLQHASFKDAEQVKRKLVELGPKGDFTVWATGKNGQNIEVGVTWLPHLDTGGK